ncbi:MAG: hypothetical protein E7616_06990 [Ruminococcaceae bacterium]|nr:hypothetical protein [Oscillospiraceae bacterium]
MKKIITWILVCFMLLSLVPAMAFGAAAEKSFEITPYEPYTLHGFENWAGKNGLQTQLLICTESFPAGIDESVVWELTFDDGVTRTTIRRAPTSTYQHWLYRFEICTGNDPSSVFVPKKGVNYSVSARIKLGDTEYASGKTSGFICDPSPIVPSHNVKPGNIVLTPLFTAWENWENSPNKGEENAVTQLLVGIKDENGNILDIPDTYDWRLTITKDGVSKTIHLPPATKSLGYDGLYRFETCLGKGENQFIPQQGADYKIKIMIYDGDALMFAGSSDRLFNCPIIPIVPEDTNGAKSILLTSLFEGFENWENSPNKGDNDAVTQLLIGIKDRKGAAADIDMELDWRLHITHLTTGEKGVYHIKPATKALVYDGLYRFEVCLAKGKDRFVPKNGQSYKVHIEVYDGEELLYTSTASDAYACTAYCAIEPIVVESEEEKSDSHITIIPGTPAWINDSSSPNKGEDAAVTQLVMQILGASGIYKELSFDLIWELTIDDGEFEDTITLSPVRSEKGTYYFETVLGEDINWFIPEKGVSYTVTLKIYDAEHALLFESEATEGFDCDIEPVVPEGFLDDGGLGDVFDDLFGDLLGGEEEGETDDKKEEPKEQEEKDEGPSILVIILLAAGAALVLAGGAVTVTVLVMKKKNTPKGE